ncbi:DNA-directed RNA polymerase II subunit rpb7 [Neolecta irregularis DAH-3]|uniref:DNA-directed RNA polymerase subunit n=1 Tax=Neolecta irregularis (strain DAH-3) TaxID=1198029 RepID=A0A1U7LR44_NEOID|nr:DNA-directed RNA polymerase II subunit rpb7 [Neolecta irregularis DAH-3]|eukprot:OLL25098.1 DNA-directed RNA polymerase II subunit rpb7 [Neolecta irregularis DAH-3]
MFFLVNHPLSPFLPPQKDLTRTIALHPSCFGPRLRDFLKIRLLAEVEGTCTGQHGYIVCVLDSNKIEIGAGKIVPGTGMAEFSVLYKAVLFKPFKGEVVDATVQIVNKMGFFADVGPMRVFVSVHSLPSDMKWEPSSNPPSYASDDQIIEKGAKVRLRIIGTRTDATEIFAIASIKEDYLGVI